MTDPTTSGNPSPNPAPARAPGAPFEKVPANVSFPKIEEAILALWQRLDAFQESNRRRAGKPEFVFYDGPPFATGTPHYGHLLAGTIKDIVPRYWSMRGHHVERRFGWDCHGLPIENLAQQALGLKGAADIRKSGIAAFNEQCRSMVQTYVGDWRKTVTRMGRWVDFDNDYKTMDPAFMESVWWVFKQLWDKQRVYKAHRIMPYDPVLATPLSNFEAGNNYKDVQDPAVTVKFKLKHGIGHFSARLDDQPTNPDAEVHVLAWTTTPWTLPENLALCVGPNISYCLIEDAKTHAVYVLAEDRVTSHFKRPEDYRVLGEASGQELHGEVYEPLFPAFAEHAQAFRVITDDFVTTGDGTGIVHMAPAYGEDDYRVCRREGIAPVDPLDAECRFDATLESIGVPRGTFCKDADKAIIKHLKDGGKLLHQSTIVHSYPYGERSEAPLIYRAIEAWYVKVEDIRDKLMANNAKIRWIPESIGSNRMGNWLKDAKDWNISRNRFWGSCIPVWVNVDDAKDMLCVGSVDELERLSGIRVTDLHKHHVDQVEIRKDGKTYRRTPEVLDCWFESGAMPYGQQHYPFENKQRFEANFPAQFIAEGLDQTRGWFYTLLVLSTTLFDKPAFTNVVVNGLILAEDGQKMSKRKQNYPDPGKVLDEIGADALRAYLINSPVVRAEPMRFSEAGLKEMVRTVVLPYWNALTFFTTYASVDGYDPRAWQAKPATARPESDRWILSVLQSLVRDVNTEMQAYRLYAVVPRLVSFIDDLTNWYIRTSRPRFWKSKDRADQTSAYATLYEVLVGFSKVLAPFMPFLTEEVHQRLVRTVDAAAPASVHWCDYPQPRAELIDAELEAGIAIVRTVVGLGRKQREDNKLKVRQPLARLIVVSRDAAVRDAAVRHAAQIADELNVKRVETSLDEAAFCAISVKPNFKELRARAGAKLKDIGTELGRWGHAEVARLEAGERIVVVGEPLGLADVLLQRSSAEGSLVASEGAVTVVLDTKLTPELVREGAAREFISALQQARKGAGLEVSDRIAVRWHSESAEVAEGIGEHAAYIAEEILASGFARDPALPPDGASCEINGARVLYALAKA